ncbi:formyl transferase domain protein [Ammonifex degensii KC4]|uniref:phosphoribosylglycinamide formyltransferase 1 n=1 Tax=Ammonifex degensii (strain DSM 10501 / KC4) TaxID=429009 RepID=C9RCR0_AMMDK|nr:formyltransferase family protein [Ammonifex degensii]ACX52037.1 formyl transferase domain protein [Ammonifex degensii KC4]
MRRPLRIGWFSTGRDRAARDLLKLVLRGIEDKELNLEIAFVFCNREERESPETDAFLDLVRSAGLRLITLSSRKFAPEKWRTDRASWREAYHEAVWERIKGFEVDFSFLAGYMLIVGEGMCRRHRMLNLHPALPGGPKGTWQEVIWTLLTTRAREAGAMIHLVTPELDAGPPVTYCRFPLDTPAFKPLWKEFEKKLKTRTLEEIQREEGEEEPLFREIRKQEFVRELPLIWLTLRKLALREIVLTDQGVVYQGRLFPGIDLSAEVEALLPRLGQVEES